MGATYPHDTFPARDFVTPKIVTWATAPRRISMTTLGAASTAANGGGGGGEGSSPAKRKAAEVVDVEDAISLGALKAELKAHQEAMKRDLQHAIGGVQKDMAERVTTVESEVTKQLQTTLALLKQLTDKQDNQGAKIAEVVEGQRYLEDKMEANQRSLEERIEKLEAAGRNLGQSINSMATTDDGIGAASRHLSWEDGGTTRPPTR